MALRGRIGSMAMAFATLLLAVSAPVASAQSYSFFYDTVTFSPTGMPAPAPTAVPAPAPIAVPAPAPTAAPVVLSVSLTVSIACADYGASEADVFAAALESVLGLASGAVDADQNDCTTISRRRNLLQTSSSELGFTITISGAAVATATTTSIAASVQASIDDDSFATALNAAATALSYSGTVISSVVVSGVMADTMAPTPRPTAAPTPRPTAAPVTPSTPAPSQSVVIESD